MHVLAIIMLTPLAIVLGLILLNLFFSWRAWAVLLGLIAFVFFLVLITPTPAPRTAALSPSKPAVIIIPDHVIAAENAEREARWRWLQSSTVDYPYLRAWAGLQGWSSIRFEDNLRIARRHKAPADTVHQGGRDWITMDDIDSPTMRASLDKIVRE